MTQAYLGRTQLQKRISQAMSDQPLAPAVEPTPDPASDGLTKEDAHRNAQAIKGLFAQVPGAGRASG